MIDVLIVVGKVVLLLWAFYLICDLEIKYNAALKVVKAAKELSLSRTSSHNWKGDPQKLIYNVERKTLTNLFDSLKPFSDDGGTSEGD